MDHINQPEPRRPNHSLFSPPSALSFSLIYVRLVPSDPSVANIIANPGFCTTGFSLRLSLFLEIMATGLKTNHIATPRRYTVVRLSAEILCSPSPASFVTICFALRFSDSSCQPCEIPTSVRGRKARAFPPPIDSSVDFEIGTSAAFSHFRKVVLDHLPTVCTIDPLRRRVSARSCARVHSFQTSTRLACTNYTAKLPAKFGRASLKRIPNVSDQCPAIIRRRLNRAYVYVYTYARTRGHCHEQVVLTGPYSAPLKRRQTYS